jgi:hypothetical protein
MWRVHLYSTPAWSQAREGAIAPDGVDRVQLDGGPLGPDLDEGECDLMARNSESSAEVHRSAWAVLIGGILLIAGCSAPVLNVPVLRTPAFIDAPDYDSPQCEEARRLDAQAATWWLPASCFKAMAR